MHPESPNDGEGIDYGGAEDGGNFGQLTNLVNEVRDLKITVFVTPAWIMRPYYFTGRLPSLLNLLRGRRHYPHDAFRLDSNRHSGWCSWLNEKVRSANFEVAVHGLTHFNMNAKHAGLEFYGLSKAETINRIIQAEEIFKSAGMPFVKGFRPPGWYWSGEMIDAIEELGYSYFAGSGDMIEPVSETAVSKRVGYPGVSLVYPDHISDHSFVTFAANAREGEYERALEVAKCGGLVLLHTHIGPSAYGIKHLNSKSGANLARMIGDLKQHFNGEVWFASLSEIARRCRMVENVRVKSERLPGGTLRVEIMNANNLPLEDLTVAASELNLEGASTDSNEVTIRNKLINVAFVDARQSVVATLKT